MPLLPVNHTTPYSGSLSNAGGARNGDRIRFGEGQERQVAAGRANMDRNCRRAAS